MRGKLGSVLPSDSLCRSNGSNSVFPRKRFISVLCFVTTVSDSWPCGRQSHSIHTVLIAEYLTSKQQTCLNIKGCFNLWQCATFEQTSHGLHDNGLCPKNWTIHITVPDCFGKHADRIQFRLRWIWLDPSSWDTVRRDMYYFLPVCISLCLSRLLAMSIFLFSYSKRDAGKDKDGK